ncbi:MAG: hypothetical protein H7833_00510 [Magnetococcus sp. DMHC-1]
MDNQESKSRTYKTILYGIFLGVILTNVYLELSEPKDFNECLYKKMPIFNTSDKAIGVTAQFCGNKFKK